MVSCFKESYLPCVVIIIISSSSSSSSNFALSEGCRIFSLTNSKLLRIILQEVLAAIAM